MARVLKKLVIVESPAKARKIGGYLGEDYIVEASVGHIRDLPQRAADIPKEYKKIAWAKEGVNIEEDFAPLYVINPDKKAKVAELKALMKDAEELILATDEDREGEAIAWHLVEVLEPKIPIKRMVFNEITKEAIQSAVENTRDLDYDLIDAQETRRVLDRLFGYRLSPVLWKKGDATHFCWPRAISCYSVNCGKRTRTNGFYFFSLVGLNCQVRIRL